MSSPDVASISRRAKIGHNVEIGPFTIVHDNVVLEDNVRIGSHCILGEPTVEQSSEPLVIGKNSLIRSHSVFYQGSQFGEGLQTGHQVTVREGTIAGKNLKIGTLCDLQGNQTLGNYIRLLSSVHVGQHAVIKDFVWVYPYTVLTNDPHPPSEVRLGVTLEDFSIVATSCCLLPGVTVGNHALVGAASLVKHDVEPGWVVSGQPAQKRMELSKLKLKDGSGHLAYPWTRHFHRGYPEEIVAQWVQEANAYCADQVMPLPIPTRASHASTAARADRC